VPSRFFSWSRLPYSDFLGVLPRRLFAPLRGLCFFNILFFRSFGRDILFGPFTLFSPLSSLTDSSPAFFSLLNTGDHSPPNLEGNCEGHFPPHFSPSHINGGTSVMSTHLLFPDTALPGLGDRFSGFAPPGLLMFNRGAPPRRTPLSQPPLDFFRPCFSPFGRVLECFPSS